MARDPADLHEIEKRILQRLEDKGFGTTFDVEEFDLGHYPENVRAFAVNVGVESGKTIERTARYTFKQGVEIRIVLACKHLGAGGDEEQKRAKTLPVVDYILKVLCLQDLNLQIDQIQPVGFRYRTAPEAFRAGFIVWEINVSTAYFMEFEPDEEPAAIHEIFVDYFLQDTIPEELDNADASDLIETQE